MDAFAFNLQKEIWQDEAHINAIKLRIDQIEIENKMKESDIAKYKEENVLLVKEAENMNVIKERIENFHTITSQNKTSLQQHAAFLEKEFKAEMKKIEEASLKYHQQYLDYKNQIESRHPLFKEHKDAKAFLKRAKFEYKYYNQMLIDLNEQKEEKISIQRKIRNKNIVKLVEAIQERREAEKLDMEIKKLRKIEAELLEVYEKKLMQKKTKNIEDDFQFEKFMLSPDIVLPNIVNENSTTFPKKSVTFEMDTLNKFKPMEENLRSQNLKKNNDFAVPMNPNKKKVNIISVENVNEYAVPGLTKKLKTTHPTEFKTPRSTYVQESLNKNENTLNCSKEIALFSTATNNNQGCSKTPENVKQMLNNQTISPNLDNREEFTNTISSLNAIETVPFQIEPVNNSLTKMQITDESLNKEESSTRKNDNNDKHLRLSQETKQQSKYFNEQLVKSPQQNSQGDKSSQRKIQNETLLDEQSGRTRMSTNAAQQEQCSGSTQGSSFSQNMIRWKNLLSMELFKETDTDVCGIPTTSNTNPQTNQMRTTNEGITNENYNMSLYNTSNLDSDLGNYGESNITFSPPGEVTNFFKPNIATNLGTFKFEDATSSNQAFLFKDSQRFNMF